jgi:3-oxoacyl-[acyl-carrier-protein] synthase-1
MTDMEKERNLKYTVITDKGVTVCGRVLEHNHTGSAMLTEIYRAQLGDWPKFFKMDTLSKVGYLAAELLLKELGERRLEGEEYASDRAIVLFGTTASLCADRNYQETIQDSDNYYPSPALFVYTLPNIVTGEIAIRNHYRGETSFYVLDGYDTGSMAFHLQCAFQDDVTESLLAGWVDSTDNDDFRCFFTLMDRADASDLKGLENELKGIMDNLK